MPPPIVTPLDSVAARSCGSVLSGGLLEDVGKKNVDEVCEEVLIGGNVEETTEVLFVEVSVPLLTVELAVKERVVDERSVVDVDEGMDVVLDT